MIDILKLDLFGKEVTIVGFTNILGKPLSVLLADKLSTVSITHIATYQTGKLAQYVKRADILITAVGKSSLIKGEWIKKGSVVIDVGISRVGDKLDGDVEFNKAKNIASAITPVPKGVGILTAVFLFYNLIKAKELQNG